MVRCGAMVGLPGHTEIMGNPDKPGDDERLEKSDHLGAGAV
jgi:hypothetical protein